MSLDMTGLEEQMRTVAGFILDCPRIPEHVLVALDRVNQKVPAIHALKAKADKYDSWKAREVPDLDVMRKLAMQLESDATYYRARADGLRQAHPVVALSLDVIARSCQKQSNHLLLLITKYRQEAAP